MTQAQQNFISTIGNAAVSFYPKYKILPSLTIAQAILESGWGKSTLASQCYNYFGMKWNKSCGCDYQEFETKEQNPDGSYITIMAKFRKYKSPADGIQGYYDFISGNKRYSNLVGVTDPELACDLIRQDGWATALAYATNLKRIIKQYSLTDYDKKVSTDKAPVAEKTSFLVKVTIDDLNIRIGPGTNTAKTGKCTGKGIFTIVEVSTGQGSSSGWGKLKSGAGWIALDYAQKLN